jgi:hypothetical protein
MTYPIHRRSRLLQRDVTDQWILGAIFWLQSANNISVNAGQNRAMRIRYGTYISPRITLWLAVSIFTVSSSVRGPSRLRQALSNVR